MLVDLTVEATISVIAEAVLWQCAVKIMNHSILIWENVSGIIPVRLIAQPANFTRREAGRLILALGKLKEKYNETLKSTLKSQKHMNVGTN